jgi:DNA polymerase III gamma/tau subunit
VADELFSGGENMSRFALELLNRFHFLLVIKACKEPPKGTRISDAKFLKDVAERVTIEECQQWFNLLYRGAEDIARSKFPKIVLDVLLVNLTLVRPISGIDALIERVEALKEAGEKSPAVAQSVIPAKAGISREPAPAKEPVAQQTADTARPAKPDQSWGAFVEWLKLNRPQVASYLDPSSGGSFLDGTLAIKFPRKCFASDQLNDADKKAFLEKLASDFCKRPIKVDLSFDSQEGPVDTKKQNREEIAAKNREIKDEALHHDVIKDTAGIFGAEITEIKVK